MPGDGDIDMKNELHEIRFAKKEEAGKIQAFIKNYWKEDHIYVNDTAFFLYDFNYGDKLNIVIALNKDGEIQGMLGCFQYNEALKGSDLFCAMWKVLPKNGEPQLGIRLLLFLKEQSGARSVSTVGANINTLPIYNFLGYKTGRMEHYYVVNSDLKEFQVVGNYSAGKLKRDNTPAAKDKLVEVVTDKEVLALYNSLPAIKTTPSKSTWYFEKRYLKHPYYKYRFFVAKENGIAKSIFVVRGIKTDTYKVLRIVDLLGDDKSLIGAGAWFQELLQREKAEYIDFYFYGIPKSIMADSGFTRRAEKSKVIIPNYFEPLTLKNIEIYFFSTKKRNLRFYKGDGDQDRPSKALTIN